MAHRTLRSALASKLDTILRGIDTRQVTAADKLEALASALRHYSRDRPRISVADFAGDGGNYYIAYGLTTEVADTDRDASIDITSSGADQQLAVSFTLPRRMTVHAIRLLLRRVGSPAGTLACQVRLPSGSVPGTLAAQTSGDLDPDVDLTLGYESGKTEFLFATPLPLAAGTYYAAIVPSGYTYASGTTEINLGVDQSSVTNTLYTYNGTSWSAYGTDSAGIIEVIASLPDWDFEFSDVRGADVPAPSIADDEAQVTKLEDEDFQIVRVGETQWLYLPNHSPASTDTIRLHYSGRYLFNGSPSSTDIPPADFEAVATLSAYYTCLWLADKYAQNVDSGLSADIADRRNQSDVYASRARGHLEDYGRLMGIDVSGEAGTGVAPAMHFGDLDRRTYSGRDFLYHHRRVR